MAPALLPDTPLVGLRPGGAWTNFVGTFPPVPHAACAVAPPGADERWVREALALAERRGWRVRARGTGWSFSPIVPGEGLLLDLRALDGLALLAGEERGPGVEEGEALLLGPGTTLTAACAFAEVHGRSLRVTNGRGGLTVAGALATGSHGAAVDLPPLGDDLLGIALLLRSDRAVWVEGERPVLSDAALRARGWQRLADPELLDAARVHLGCLGVVLALALATVPAFDLDHHWQRLPLAPLPADLLRAPSTATLPAPQGTGPLYHANLVINPHDPGPARLSTAWTAPPLSPPSAPVVRDGWLPEAGALLTGIPRRWPGAVRPILEALLAGAARPAHLRGRLGTVFPARVPRGYRPISQEFALDAARAPEAVEAALRILRDRPDGFAHPGFLALRWMRGTRALLGFTRFQRTLTMELPTLRCPGVERTFGRLHAALAPLGAIEHPGQHNHDDAASFAAAFGARLVRWREARHRLLGADAWRFGNAMTDRLGLTAP